MIYPSAVSAVLVTRGDQNLQEIYDSIEQAGITDIVTWDNSKSEIDVATYGRYLGIESAKNEFIYFQDDDLVSPVTELLERWDPRFDQEGILANNRVDEEWPLIGIGSLFHRDLGDCFEPYLDLYGFDREFCRHTCDVIFGYQFAYRRVVLGYFDLPWQKSPGVSLHLDPYQNIIRREARDRLFAMPQVALT